MLPMSFSCHPFKTISFAFLSPQRPCFNPDRSLSLIPCLPLFIILTIKSSTPSSEMPLDPSLLISTLLLGHGFHSFRRSGVTLAFDHNIQLQNIMAHGLQRSSLVWIYLQNASCFQSSLSHSYHFLLCHPFLLLVWLGGFKIFSCLQYLSFILSFKIPNLDHVVTFPLFGIL